jgi:hypothetical protein
MSSIVKRGIFQSQGNHCDIGAYVYENLTPPTVLSIVRADPNPTSAGAVNFTVSFSGNVLNVGTGDFSQAQEPVIRSQWLLVPATIRPAWTWWTMTASSKGMGFRWAEQAYKDELIPSCRTSADRPNICPKSMVSRGLGAYMIVRAKSLKMP